jgi:hypothetical protein
MRFEIHVSFGAEEQTIAMAELSIIPSIGDTVELGTCGDVGVIKERHFRFEPPDFCRINFVCRHL